MRALWFAIRSRSAPLWLDCLIAVLLFGAAGVWGAVSWKRSVANGQPFYYQLYFEPAVMIACGKGFVVTEPQVPVVVPFLRKQVDRFRCADIPPVEMRSAQTLTQGPWRYLMTAVGWTWRLFGVSWSAMAPLFGTLFGAMVVAAYAVFRLGAGPLLAVLCSWGIAVSSLHLAYLPSLRDYAKAPFTLILIFLLGLLVLRKATWKGTLAVSAAYGAVLGVGYGFRTDFLAEIPPFVLALAVFLKGGISRNLRLKASAAALFAVMFFATGWPIVLSVYRSFGCQWHTVLLGFAQDFTRPLDLERPPYELSRQYLDEFAYTSVTSYAGRVRPGIGHIEYCTPRYEAAVSGLLRDLVRHFPADIVVRAYASILRIVELPFTWWYPAPAPTGGLDDQPPNPHAGHGAGLVLMVLTVGLISGVSVRLGVFLVLFLLYFAGYPAIQFDARNYFHFEFVTWWTAAFLLQTAVSDWRAPAKAQPPRAVVPPALRALAVVGFSAAGMIVLLWTARLYQGVVVRSLFETYLVAPRNEIPFREALSEAVVPVMPPPARTDPETADFLDVSLNAWRCRPDSSVSFRYADAVRKDYGRVFTVPRVEDRRELTHIFMPVYDGFQGIVFSDASPGCIDGVYRLRTEGQPLLLETVLSPGWQKAPLYQRLRGRRSGS
jgi:hypothetical protein